MGLAAFLEVLNDTLGLWTALTAIAAVAAALTAKTANRTTAKALHEAKASQRPWLSTAGSELVTRPGGFVVRLGIRNYGALPAANHQIRAWRCEDDDVNVLRQTTSANVIVPNEEVAFSIECQNHTPRVSCYLAIRLSYEDEQSRLHDSWLFYNWPIKTDGTLADTLRASDLEPAKALRKRLSAL